MSQAEYSIHLVSNETEKNIFIKFPWKIYKGNPNWVPPMLFDVKNNLDKKKNPFYAHSKMEMWMVKKDGEIAGRIAAIINDNHNIKYKDKTGFFGFFESIDDKNVSKLLFDTASDYLRKNGMETVRGPINPSMNDECGLLLDAFDQPPVILMTYNPRYYIDLIEDYGFSKCKDIFAYFINTSVINNKEMMAKLERIVNIIKNKENIKIRKVNLKDFDNEVMIIRELYNNAWIDNWGSVPMTVDEFKYVAKTLKSIANPDFILFAEVNGKPVGFTLSLPNMNQVLIKLNGTLFPFGIFKFLANRKKINELRVIMMGVLPEYQRRGIDSVFYHAAIVEGSRKKLRGAEISWVLEDNMAMRQTAEKLGAYIYKTYRIFEKNII